MWRYRDGAGEVPFEVVPDVLLIDPDGSPPAAPTRRAAPTPGDAYTLVLRKQCEMIQHLQHEGARHPRLPSRATESLDL